MEIRPATVADLPEITRVYAHHVLHGTGTFETTPPGDAEIGARFSRAIRDGYCWLVAEDETGLLGFAHYGPFRERAAFRYTVEDSIYVRDDVRGQGVGKELVSRLIEEASAAGFRQMLALIGDSDNVASIGMHASLGFVRTGVLRATGTKFGRELDVVIMQRALDPTEAASAAIEQRAALSDPSLRSAHQAGSDAAT